MVRSSRASFPHPLKETIASRDADLSFAASCVVGVYPAHVLHMSAMDINSLEHAVVLADRQYTPAYVDATCLRWRDAVHMRKLRIQSRGVLIERMFPGKYLSSRQAYTSLYGSQVRSE